jgi:hypothetical protein
MVTMVPLGLWLYPMAIGMALMVAVLLVSRWLHSRVRLLVGLGGTVALSLMAVGSVSLTLVGIWLLVAAGLLALSVQGMAVRAAMPPQWRLWATGGIGLFLVVALTLATLMPGKIPTRVAAQFDAIARQLHQPLIYITAVIGLPDQPMLVSDPSP